MTPARPLPVRSRLVPGTLVLACLLAAAAPASAARHRVAELPPVMLWAWEQPTDLRDADPARVGVAWLGATIALTGTRVAEYPRRQPLRVAPGMAQVAVLRVEVPRGARAALTPVQERRIVRRAQALAATPGVLGVQVDFDAPRSARPFYRRLLARLRAELPDSSSLSMTALASWALGDAWLDGLPVEAAVPMAFRMGADAARVRRELGRGDFTAGLARGNLGVDLDEPWPAAWRGRRLWLFTRGAWTPARRERAWARMEKDST
ncbi:MAG: hypothetical protein U0704_10895 [Candidatus Eisenbacteria bacterium]